MQTICPQLVPVLDRKEQTSITRATRYSAVSEDMPWLCQRTPQHATADLHMLAADIVSTFPSLIPRYPVSSAVIVWSRQSFISSASGSVGLRQIWVWAALSVSLRTDYYLNIMLFLAQKVQLYANNRQKNKKTIPLQKMTCLDKQVVSLHGAAGITFICLKVKQWLILYCSGFDNTFALLHSKLIWPFEMFDSIKSNRYTVHQLHCKLEQ